MGPLDGIRVVEMAGIGPAPFCAMLLADLGADVIRVDRPSTGRGLPGLDRVNCRNRRSVGLDLKHPDGVRVLLELLAGADVLIEGLRPGVAERLGFGPDVCLNRNQRLVYGRMTGWGQTGPRAKQAGHDLNYISLTGALHAIGGEEPIPPLNLVGDFGGGAMYLAFGVLAALVERERSGHGQVVDAAMVDGATSLMAMFYEFTAMGLWSEERGQNLLDGGAPFYTVYETADGEHVAVAALEPQFYAEFLRVLGLDASDLPAQYDRAGWPRLRETFGRVLMKRPRAEWATLFADSDACVTPVLSMGEAVVDDHLTARRTHVEVEGEVQPAPAPRFSRSQPSPPAASPEPGEHTTEVLLEVGLAQARIDELRAAGVVF